MSKRKKRFSKLFVTLTVASCAALFLASCILFHKPVVVPPGDIDILGFVKNNIVIADAPIVEGVVVTTALILDYHRLRQLEKKGKLQ